MPRQLRLACWYAQCLGWPVHPVNEKKRPLTQHAWKDATRDCEQIAEWWWRWPTANISTPTGIETGIIVLDIDRKPDRDGVDTLKQNGWTIPPTWAATTPSGGLHVYFRHPGQQLPPSCDKIGVGLDIRGDLSSIILPSWTRGRRWSVQRPGRCPLLAMPGWLMRAAFPAAELQREHVVSTEPPPPIDGAKHLSAALEQIRNAVPGSRQCTVSSQSFRIGCLVREGHAPEDTAVALMLDAVRRVGGGDWDRAQAVKDSLRSFRDGRDS